MSEEGNTDIDGTEQQRRALEDMSQALLDRLNEMVKEQEARAQEFAARSHSLSALPEQVVLEQPVFKQPSSEPKLPQKTAAPAKTHVAIPPLTRVDSRPKVEETPPHRRAEVVRPKPMPKQAKEEGSINVAVLIGIAFVIFVILRACS